MEKLVVFLLYRKINNETEMFLVVSLLSLLVKQ